MTLGVRKQHCFKIDQVLRHYKCNVNFGFFSSGNCVWPCSMLGPDILMMHVQYWNCIFHTKKKFKFPVSICQQKSSQIIKSLHSGIFKAFLLINFTYYLLTGHKSKSLCLCVFIWSIFFNLNLIFLSCCIISFLLWN